MRDTVKQSADTILETEWSRSAGVMQRKKAVLSVGGRKKDETFLKNRSPFCMKIFTVLLHSMVKEEETARDIAQNTMEKAWKNLYQLKNRKSVKAWVYRIARNEVNVFFRDTQRTDSFDGPESRVDCEKAEKAEADILEILLKKERSGLLLRAFDMLSPRYREIVSLWALGDLSQKEIARVLQMNYSTMRVHLYRGLNELRDLYFALERGDADE